jgi:hypothetical protein
VQGIPDGISARIEAQKRRKLEALRVAMDADAEIDRLIEIDRAEHKTPAERRADIRRRNTSGVRKTLAAIGALGVTEFLRSHRRAAIAVAIAAGATGMVAAVPGSTDLLDVAPDEPSVVATQAPRPTVAPGDGFPKMPGAPPARVNPGLEVPSDLPSTVGPSPPTGDAAPGPASRPAVTRPPHASLPGTTAPEPTQNPPDLDPAPEPEPEPEPSAPPEPEPPLPSVTAEPPQMPATPADEPLLCIDIDELLGVCADLDLPLADGLLGGRGIWG